MNPKNKTSEALINLPAEQIKKYKKSGHWPPPQGIIVLPEKLPSQDGVIAMLDSLSNILPPQKRKSLERAKEKVKKKPK